MNVESLPFVPRVTMGLLWGEKKRLKKKIRVKHTHTQIEREREREG